MKTLLFIFLLLPSFSFAESGSLRPEIKSRLEAFVRPLTAEYASLYLEKAWLGLGIKDKENEEAKLKHDLKAYGPIRKMTLVKRHDSVGSLLVVLTHKIVFKSGRQDQIEFTFIKRMDDPYELFDVKVN